MREPLVVLWLGDVFGCYKFTCKGFEGRQTTVELEDNKVVVWGTELSDSTAIAIVINSDQIVVIIVLLSV